MKMQLNIRVAGEQVQITLEDCMMYAEVKILGVDMFMTSPLAVKKYLPDHLMLPSWQHSVKLTGTIKAEWSKVDPEGFILWVKNPAYSCHIKITDRNSLKYLYRLSSLASQEMLAELFVIIEKMYTAVSQIYEYQEA